MVAFRASVTDPSSDPLNQDFAAGVLTVSWAYDLPVRAFETRQEISIYGGMNPSIACESNNEFYNRAWSAIFAGLLRFGGELFWPLSGNPFPVPISVNQDWTTDDENFTFLGQRFERSRRVAAGEKVTAELLYYVNLGSDLATTTANGAVYAD